MKVRVKGFSDRRLIYDQTLDFMSDEFDLFITKLWDKLEQNIINKIIVATVYIV